MNPVSNDLWTVTLTDKPVSISLTRVFDKSVCVVAVCQSKGIGSVLDASESAVSFLLGSKGDGVHEAFARSILQITGSKRVIATISVSDLTPLMVKELLSDIRSKVSS